MCDYKFKPLTILLQNGKNPFSEIIEELTSRKEDIAHVIVVLDDKWALEAHFEVRLVPIKEIMKRDIEYAIIPSKTCDQATIFKSASKILGHNYDILVVLTHFIKKWFGKGINLKNQYDCVEVARHMVESCFGPTELFNDFSAPVDLLLMDGKDGWTVKKIG